MEAKFLNVIVKATNLPDKVWADMYRPELHTLVDGPVVEPVAPVEEAEEGFKCDKCGKFYKTETSLKSHNTKMHSDPTV